MCLNLRPGDDLGRICFVDCAAACQTFDVLHVVDYRQLVHALSSVPDVLRVRSPKPSLALQVRGQQHARFAWSVADRAPASSSARVVQPNASRGLNLRDRATRPIP